MKKIIWIIVAAVIGGYFINSYMEKNAKLEMERVEAERVAQTTKTAVSIMASRTNAVEDWEARLCKGKRFRSEPILTVELENLWLQQRPILIIGAIKDITTYDQSHYEVLVERNFFSSSNLMFGTELQFTLISSKDRIDPFLKKHPSLFKGYGLKNGVAVVAIISSIKSAYVSSENGERKEVKIGEGELIDILYTGGVRF